jgi:hypothetical protein
MFFTSLWPTYKLIFPGSYFSSYGFPLTYFRRYFLDLIGGGVSFNLSNALADYFIWFGATLICVSAIEEVYSRLLRKLGPTPMIKTA